MNDTQVLAPSPVMERKCHIEEVFDVNFIELLKLVPANPYVRALILKFTGKQPPPECELFDQLKDWVEFNCVKRIRKSGGSRTTGEGGISIGVDFSEMEYGRANYSVERYGHETFRVSADDLIEIIREAIANGGGLGEVVVAIADRVDDDAWEQCDPELDGYGDYDYSDHDESSSDTSKISYARPDIRSAVLQFVQERYPELVAEL